jgi:hypothetical protein
VHPLYDNFGEQVDKRKAKEYLGIKANGNVFFSLAS